MALGEKTTPKEGTGTGSYIAPKGGQCVTGNKLISLKMCKRQEVEQTNRAELIIEQENGARVVIEYFYDEKYAWSEEIVNEQFQSLGTALVGEAAYFKAIGKPESFKGMVEDVNDLILDNSEKVFSMKFVYSRDSNPKSKYFHYPVIGVPRYGNFIELDGTEPSTLAAGQDKYNVFAYPGKPSEDEIQAEFKRRGIADQRPEDAKGQSSSQADSNEAVAAKTETKAEEVAEDDDDVPF